MKEGEGDMQFGGNKGQVKTTLAELINNLDSLNEESTIYAIADPDWSESSLAVAVLDPDGGSLPPEAAGMKYLLEVAIAKEVLDVWREWRQGKTPTIHDKCEAVIYYAKNDSYLPV